MITARLPVRSPPRRTSIFCSRTFAYAEYLNAVGARARQRGQTLMVHNHDIEFETVFGNYTVFDILMANTDPKNVVFQLDLYWATNGGGVTNRSP